MSLLLAEPTPEATTPDQGEEGLRRVLTRRLWTAGYPELRKVRVTVHNGTIELHGCVSSYYLKQAAQEVALRFDRTRKVKNEVRVTH